MLEQKEKSELEQQIQRSGINEAVDALKTNLKSYNRSETSKNHRYEILRKIMTIEIELSKLNELLIEIISESEHWEKFE
jgi:hypothetical protein